MSYPPVPLDAAAGDLAGQSVAVVGTGPDGQQTVVLLVFGKVRDGRVLVRLGDTATRTPMPQSVMVRVGAAIRLDSLVLAHANVAATRAGLVPRITGSQSWPTFVLEHPRMSLIVALGFVVAIVLTVALVWPGALMNAISGALMITITAASLRLRSASGEVYAVEDGETRPSVIAARVPVPEAALITGGDHLAGLTPQDRVQVVKSEYGRLLTDICYRIENSALFDAAVAETSRFQVALLSWDPDATDAERLAIEVESSFAAARRHAEELGWDHLPTTAREPARRARLAAITALGDGPEGERAAARGRVADILGSLALYYLPPVDADAAQLIGQRRAIEPAPRHP